MPEPDTDIIPFPYPLGLGTDICHIPRIKRILSNENPNYVERFTQRIFTEAELADFHQRHARVLQLKQNLENAISTPNGSSLEQDRYDRGLWKLSSWVAGRFAAKEAAIKAVSPRRLEWHHAEILVLAGQMKPLLVIHNPQRTDDQIQTRLPVGKHAAQLSISHDGEYAIATVLAAV
ncbi:hypothetical protein BDV26DRAFT_256431 [Aspergillus bertholletiae]|uniref:4'-phosphopantetheinyl transferase domain-containing protein n=1 Tax=Aspergillus bertholletiae TaxID=1226010 RepID=A0A5N7BGJ6_9EURO|nr:hypothetical protein BDV26DRAFT_256431 [Aspergillus bertholletiae]